MSQYPQSDNQVGEQKIRKNSQKCQFLPKLTFGAYNTTLRCWLNLKHVVLYAGHMYKPFWTTKIWLGRQWGSGKVKIRSNMGQYGVIFCHILTFPHTPCRPGQIIMVQNGLYMCPANVRGTIIPLHLRLTDKGSWKKSPDRGDDGLRPLLRHSVMFPQ